MSRSRISAAHARTTVLSGCAMLAVAIVLLALPFVLGKWEPNKYLVVVGLVLLFAGASCVLHGTLDWIRAR
jgi:hypothetical protein